MLKKQAIMSNLMLALELSEDDQNEIFDKYIRELEECQTFSNSKQKQEVSFLNKTQKISEDQILSLEFQLEQLIASENSINSCVNTNNNSNNCGRFQFAESFLAKYAA